MLLMPECSGGGEGGGGLKENTSREYPAYTTVFKYRGFLFQSAKGKVSLVTTTIFLEAYKMKLLFWFL